MSFVSAKWIEGGTLWSRSRRGLGSLGLSNTPSSFPITTLILLSFRTSSDQDLKDLGVSLGHRRKIFAAINKGIARSSAACRSRRARRTHNRETARAPLRYGLVL